MGILDRFSSKEVDAFAKSLAADVAKRYPPTLDTSKAKRISVNRVTKVLETIYARAVDFQKEKGLGTYRKARLGNTFRWELTELKYSKEFVEVATEGLIVYLTRRGAPDDQSGQPAKSA